jgi:hypothetical protein
VKVQIKGGQIPSLRSGWLRFQLIKNILKSSKKVREQADLGFEVSVEGE